MAIMKDLELLLDDNGNATDHTVQFGDEVNVVVQQKDQCKVKLVQGVLNPEGWVPTESINFTGVPASAAPDLKDFATACWLQAVYFDVNAHYLVTIAKLRSDISNVPQGNQIGPYRITQEQWNAASSDHELDINFAPQNIGNWRSQCAVFALMTRRAQKSLDVHVGVSPSALDLYLEWLKEIGEAGPADDIARTKLIADMQTAIDATSAAVLEAGTELLDTSTGKGGSPPLQGPGSKPIGSTPATVTGVNLGGLNNDQQQMANLILGKFAEAGYGKLQQIAALANAILESRLDPKVKAGGNEDSWGLFQLNRHGGLGRGRDKEFLKVPENNIAIVINEAKRFSAFANAATLFEAVRVFVVDVERPADQPAAIAARFKEAQARSA